MTRYTRAGLAAAGVIVAAVAAAAVVTGGLTGVELLWPVLLGAAVGFAPGPVAGRLGGFLLGIAAGWVGVALRLVLLPDTTTGRAIAGVLVLVGLLVVSVASRERIPLWATLVGAAGFLAIAEAATDPVAAFTADRFAAASSLLLGGGVGAGAAVLARSVIVLTGFGGGSAAARSRDERDEERRP